jgi:DNA-binding NtrC family response regulator
VLIRGPSGSGKELVARALHRLSDRREGPFVAVNCAAIPESLLESELFGHEKGAFTGAVGRRPGRFEMASGGVLFLDEIGAVEEKQIQRLGSTQVIDVDVRLIAATNRDLEAAMQERRFREDLYYRLTVLTIDVPPLSERREDIPVLAGFFLESFREELGHKICGISAEALEILEQYAWPGNVRELKNVIERALVLAAGGEILPSDLSFLPAPARDAGGEGFLQTLKDMEEKHIAHVLNSVGWNKSKAARVLGIERSTLYEKLRLYGLSPPGG